MLQSVGKKREKAREILFGLIEDRCLRLWLVRYYSRRPTSVKPHCSGNRAIAKY